MVMDYFYNVFICMFKVFVVNRNPHIFPQKKHVIQKIEIITAIVTQT